MLVEGSLPASLPPIPVNCLFMAFAISVLSLIFLDTPSAALVSMKFGYVVPLGFLCCFINNTPHTFTISLIFFTVVVQMFPFGIPTHPINLVSLFSIVALV